MKRTFLSVAFASYLIILLSACILDRSGTASNVILSAEPRLFCAGDPVTISWDYTATPRRLENCEFPMGGYPERFRCDSSPDCPSGGRCIDGGCCAAGVPASECGPANMPHGCFPDLGLKITADTFVLDPPQDGAVPSARGRQVVFPPSSTRFTFEASYTPPPTVESPVTVQTTLVHPDPGTVLNVPVLFQCRGSTAGYPRVYIGEGAENVQIIRVSNPTRYTITVSNELSSGVITLRPGEDTPVFNGPVASFWTVDLSPLDSARLLVPRCDGLRVTDPKPDLAIDLKLICVPPRE